MSEKDDFRDGGEAGGLAETGFAGALAELTASRRAVLSGALATSALALPSASFALPAAPTGRMRVVFDQQAVQGRAFADQAARRGIATFGFSGDMSRLWLDTLLPALHAAPGPLAGLTRAGALFCFEQLAWTAGMRLRLRIDHLAEPEGLRHAASVPLPAPALDLIGQAGPAFGASAIDVALGCRAAWGDCTHAPAPPAAATHADALVTWVIAPAPTI